MSVDVIVWTCAQYSFLIPKFVTYWQRSFTLPYRLTYVVAGTNRVQVPRNCNRIVTHFVTMQDNGMAANILDYLDYRKSDDPFLMLMDDHIVFDACPDLIERALNYIYISDVGCVRLVPWPGPTVNVNGEFGEIDKSLEYAISLQASFWKPDTFRRVLERTWNPWEIELNGSVKARQLSERFIGCTQCAINYKDYMMRGKPRAEHAQWVDAHL